jgi:uncharacterized membrane protein YesL
MTTNPASARAQRRLDRQRWLEGHLESGRRAAECAAAGLLWTAFSIPIFTAGAAWIAVAAIFDAWSRGEEPPLVSTFVTALRTQLRAGLAAQAAFAAVAAVAYFDIRVAAAAHIPGARIEAVAIGLIAAGATGIIQLAVAQRAHAGTGMLASARAALVIAGAAPWTLPLLIVATAVCAAVVALIPALLLVMAGPLAYAVSAVYARAAGQVR